MVAMEHDPHAVAVADRVRKVLAEAGVSAAEVARRLDLPQSYVARRMTGRVAWRSTELVRVAEAIGVPPADLMPTAEPVSAR